MPVNNPSYLLFLNGGYKGHEFELLKPKGDLICYLIQSSIIETQCVRVIVNCDCYWYTFWWQRIQPPFCIIFAVLFLTTGKWHFTYLEQIKL